MDENLRNRRVVLHYCCWKSITRSCSCIVFVLPCNSIFYQDGKRKKGYKRWVCLVSVPAWRVIVTSVKMMPWAFPWESHEAQSHKHTHTHTQTNTHTHTYKSSHRCLTHATYTHALQTHTQTVSPFTPQNPSNNSFRRSLSLINPGNTHAHAHTYTPLITALRTHKPQGFVI